MSFGSKLALTTKAKHVQHSSEFYGFSWKIWRNLSQYLIGLFLSIDLFFYKNTNEFWLEKYSKLQRSMLHSRYHIFKIYKKKEKKSDAGNSSLNNNIQSLGEWSSVGNTHHNHM